MSLSFVKLDINFFQNPKIQRIARMPGGDTYIKIYAGLLTMAMKSPAPGMIMISDTMPADPADIAAHCLAKEDEVRAALSVFKRLNMVEITENVVLIPSFEEHQNLRKISEAKESTRLRVQEYRKKQRLQIGVTRTKRGRNADVTKSNAVDLDLDEDLDKDLLDVEAKTNAASAKKVHHPSLAETLYLQKYTESIGEPPAEKLTAADVIALNQMAKKHAEKFREALERFFADPYAKGIAFPVGLFRKQINRYIHGGKAEQSADDANIAIAAKIHRELYPHLYEKKGLTHEK